MAVEDKPKRFKLYGWDSERGEFFGRDLLGWVLLCAFYTVFFISLIIFIIALLAVFLETIDSTEPKWMADKSLTLGNPGLGMRPIPQYDSTLIRFQQGKAASYKPYTDHMEAFLFPYRDQLQQGRNIITCSVSKGYEKEREKTCRVDLDKVLGPCTAENDYGYEEGSPCTLFKMNRLFGFTPEPYDSIEELMRANNLTTRPRFLAFTPGLTVGVSCEGENAADRENLQEMEFYPQEFYQGFPVVNYPYLNQEGFRSPFVMARFTKFTKRVIIQIECKLYAKNIVNVGTARRHGTISFELLKD